MDVDLPGHCKKVKTENEGAVVVIPSEHIPEEILEMTFLKLENFEDLKAVSDACPQFNRILTPYKTMWAFQKIFSLIFPQLDRDDILNCRLVCNSWTWTVDSFLQTRPYNRVLETYPPAHPSSRGRQKPVYAPVYQTNLTMKDLGPMRLYPTFTVRKYMEEMSGHPSNPFVLRSVELTNVKTGHSSQKIYWKQVFRFLSKVGHHIFYATIGPKVNDDRRYPTFNYRMLRKALSRMPNLKYLCVIGFDTDQFFFDNDLDLKLRLVAYIQRFPLPALRHLEVVENLLACASKQGPVMDEIMRRCPQVKRVLTNVTFLNFTEIGSLSQLTHLSLKIDVGVLTWWTFCRKVKAPNLRRLDLTLGIKLKLSTLLNPLTFNTFPTLEYVSLRFPCKPARFSERYLPRFLLERIKTVEIFDCSNLQYEQILSHVPNLEYILVCYDKDMRSMEAEQEDEEDPMKIRGLVLSENLYQSKLWLQMEHVRSFTIAKLGETGDTETEIIPEKVFTREGYNLLQQQQKKKE